MQNQLNLREFLYLVIGNTKTRDSNRILPICDVLFNHLEEYYKTLKKKNFNVNFFVFSSNNGITPSDPKRVRERSVKRSKESNVKFIRLHDFQRHCANSGASVTMVAKYLGHTKIDVTLNTYTHMFQSALDGVIDIINNLEENENQLSLVLFIYTICNLLK